MTRADAEVVFLTTSGDVTGGAEESVLGILKYYPRSRLTPVLVGPPGGAMEREIRNMGVAFLPWNPPKLPLGFHPRKWASQRRAFALGLKELASVLDAGRPRLLTSHSLEAHMFAARRSRSTGEHVVWHIRDLLPARGTRAMFYMAERWGTVSPVFVSKATQARFYGRKTGPVLNDGLDWARFAQVAPSPSDHPVFLYVGQLLPRKGLGWLLDAWSGFSAANPEAVLRIVGEGEPEYVAALKMQAAPLGPAVEFLGYRSDVVKLLETSSGLILPSKDEALGLVILEAMACHVPVIGTPDSGMAELIEDGKSGFLVPFEERKKLCRAMQTIVDDPALAAAVARRGHAFAKKAYNAETQAERMAEYHEKMFLKT